MNSTAPPSTKGGNESGTPDTSENKEEDELDAYRDQREVAVRLSHYVHTLLYIINTQMTTIESLQAQLGKWFRKVLYLVLKFNEFDDELFY